MICGRTIYTYLATKVDLRPYLPEAWIYLYIHGLGGNRIISYYSHLSLQPANLRGKYDANEGSYTEHENDNITVPPSGWITPLKKGLQQVVNFSIFPSNLIHSKPLQHISKRIDPIQPNIPRGHVLWRYQEPHCKCKECQQQWAKSYRSTDVWRDKS